MLVWSSSSRRAFAILWVLCGAAAGVISLAFGQSKNLLVFRHAADTLLSRGDLYAAGYVDFFKYSPTFALCFVPFAHLPLWLAALLWGALNFGVAFAGMDALVKDGNKKSGALLIALAGVLLATDGDQSNLLVTGTILLALAALDRGRVVTFAILVALATHIKLFPIAAASFALLYPRPLRTLAAVGFAVVLLAVLPMLITGSHGLFAEYASWAHLVREDHAYRGWSIMTMLEDGLGLRPSGIFIQAIGIGLLTTPLLIKSAKPFSPAFRQLFAAFVLAFCVLFNHRTEYATFVISAVAVGIWWTTTTSSSSLRRALVVFAVVAHGPIFAITDASVGGPLAFLAAHRVFHPLRVLPLATVWSLMLIDLVAARLDVSFAMLRGGGGERTR
jgi:hypothetical protein